MGKFYLCRINYDKPTEKGPAVKVCEDYVVEAIGVTDAEKRVVAHILEGIETECLPSFDVQSVKRARVAEIFEDKAEKWYKAKVAFITLDAKTGEEKRKGVTMLVNAEDLAAAVWSLIMGMKDTVEEWVLTSLAETSIVAVLTDKGKEPENAGE